MKRKVLLFVVLLSMWTIPATAEPNKVVRWLMDEPASLFDISMIRMRIANETKWTPELIKRIEGKGLTIEPAFIGSVVYTFDENRITIGASFVGTPAEETCASVLREYKNIIIPSSDKFYITIFGSYFDHVNYSTEPRPHNFNTEISKLVQFTIGISDKPGLGGKKSIFCSCTIEKDNPSYKKFGF